MSYTKKNDYEVVVEVKEYVTETHGSLSTKKAMLQEQIAGLAATKGNMEEQLRMTEEMLGKIQEKPKEEPAKP